MDALPDGTVLSAFFILCTARSLSAVSALKRAVDEERSRRQKAEALRDHAEKEFGTQRAKFKDMYVALERELDAAQKDRDRALEQLQQQTLTGARYGAWPTCAFQRRLI